MPNSTSGRRRPKQARASFALDSILEAAARTLESHGKAGLTTQRVADTAGFSIGALYQYFPNKEGLIEALAGRELDRLTQMMQQALADPAPFGAGINTRRMIRAMAAFIGDRPRLYGILRAEWSDAAPGSRIGAGMQCYFELISTTLHSDNPGFTARIAAPEARFVLFRAISGVLLATALERPEYLGTRAFEDEMLRLILGFIGHELPQMESMVKAERATPHTSHV
ncbi:TetR/AcrR family transcriptional regulator [Paraburkholderia jirisanensis]